MGGRDNRVRPLSESIKDVDCLGLSPTRVEIGIWLHRVVCSVQVTHARDSRDQPMKFCEHIFFLGDIGQLFANIGKQRQQPEAASGALPCGHDALAKHMPVGRELANKGFLETFGNIPFGDFSELLDP